MYPIEPNRGLNLYKTKIDDKTFCDEFYYSYGLEMDGSTLTKLEREVFDVLSIVTGRFSCYEEDLKLYKV